MTASIRGVVPMRAVMGAKKAGNKFKLKNIAPVTSRVTGVIKAATPQPKRCGSNRFEIIRSSSVLLEEKITVLK